MGEQTAEMIKRFSKKILSTQIRFNGRRTFDFFSTGTLKNI